MDVRKKRGRPSVDRYQRRLEIYNAVTPLIMEKGAARLTMRSLAAAAYMSVGGLYHYFSSKRELLFFPLLPEVCEEQYRRFVARHRHLRDSEPRDYLKAFLEELSITSLQLRPAVRAALDIGAGRFWELMQKSMQVEMEDLLETINRVHVKASMEAPDPAGLARAIRRTVMGALFDDQLGPAELEDQLRALVLARIDATV